MKKTYTIYKNDLFKFLAEITTQMRFARVFYNVRTKDHKNPEKIIVILG